MLTYVTLDQANGGIVRNLSREGVAVQAVAAVRPDQELRVRFELRRPKLQVEARGQVMWSTPSGQCGIRFLDLSPRTSRQIQEWIFGNLLEAAAQHAGRGIFGTSRREFPVLEDDGLIVSAAPVSVIDLPNCAEPLKRSSHLSVASQIEQSAPLQWLSEPLAGLQLSWTVNALAVLAGLLLFALVFLSVAHEVPGWPVVLAGVAIVPLMYWGFFQIFGGSSLGARLARLAGSELDDEDELAGARFR
jgi:hypothetical protein